MKFVSALLASLSLGATASKTCDILLAHRPMSRDAVSAAKAAFCWSVIEEFGFNDASHIFFTTNYLQQVYNVMKSNPGPEAQPDLEKIYNQFMADLALYDSHIRNHLNKDEIDTDLIKAHVDVKRPWDMFERKEKIQSGEEAKSRLEANKAEFEFLFDASLVLFDESMDDAKFLTTCESLNWSPKMATFIQNSADLAADSDLKKFLA